MTKGAGLEVVGPKGVGGCGCRGVNVDVYEPKKACEWSNVAVSVERGIENRSRLLPVLARSISIGAQSQRFSYHGYSQ